MVAVTSSENGASAGTAGAEVGPAATGDSGPVEPTRRPSAASAAIAVCAAFAAVGALLPILSIGLGLTVVGAVSVVVGVAGTRRRYVTLGSGLQAAGIILAAVTGTAVLQIVIALGAAVVAWDVGQHAIGVGKQVGAGAVVMRGEIVRALASVAVVVATIAIATIIYSVVGGEYPVTALGSLLLAAVLFLVVLRMGG